MARAREHPRRKKSTVRGSADGAQWLTGLHAVREALRARRRRLDCLQIRSDRQSGDIEEILTLADAAGIRIEPVDRDLLEEHAEGSGNPQGVALRVGPLPELSLRALLDLTASASGGRRLVALDGVEDPHNVGAVARVAESAGAQGLILTDRRSPPVTPTVARASAGAIEWLPVARVGNLGRALAELQSAGYWVVATATEGQGSLFAMEDRLLTGDLVVVLGAEGKGVRPSVLDIADHRVEIPMMGRVASLNVSTAGAVVLYDLLRRSEAAVAREP